MFTRRKTSIPPQDVQFKPLFRAHPKNLFKFLTWKTKRKRVRDERWKCVLWKSAILFKLKTLCYFCCLKDRVKPLLVKLLKHWYKQSLKETSFLLWFSCIWYKWTIFPLQGQQYKLDTKLRLQQHSNKQLSVGSYAFIHTFTGIIQVVFFQLYLNASGPTFQSEKYCCTQLQRDFPPVLQYHCKAWELLPIYFTFKHVHTPILTSA